MIISPAGYRALVSAASLTSQRAARKDGGCDDSADVDECFELLSDDFTYWSILTRDSVDKAALREDFERRKQRVHLDLDFIQCFNDGESVVIEAEADGETVDGVHYNSPSVFIF